MGPAFGESAFRGRLRGAWGGFSGAGGLQPRSPVPASGPARRIALSRLPASARPGERRQNGLSWQVSLQCRQPRCGTPAWCAAREAGRRPAGAASSPGRGLPGEAGRPATPPGRRPPPRPPPPAAPRPPRSRAPSGGLAGPAGRAGGGGRVRGARHGPGNPKTGPSTPDNPPKPPVSPPIGPASQSLPAVEGRSPPSGRSPWRARGGRAGGAPGAGTRTAPDAARPAPQLQRTARPRSSLAVEVGPEP